MNSVAQLVQRRLGKPRRAAGALTVGALAEAVGVNVETIRYYERERLLPPPERTAGGHRLYIGADVARLRFILGAKSCGFTLAEIRDLLGLRESDIATCTDVRERAERKLAETEQKLTRLKDLRAHLKQLISDCPGGETGVDCCNIISDFEGGPKPRRKKAR
jgi:MerR family Zn(II)-responsive transcriptional regulator of zntA